MPFCVSLQYWQCAVYVVVQDVITGLHVAALVAYSVHPTLSLYDSVVVNVFVVSRFDAYTVDTH